MGADGTLYLMRLDEFARRWHDVEPEDLGLRRTWLLGVRALRAYSDTEGRCDWEEGKHNLAERAEWHRKRQRLAEEHGGEYEYEDWPGSRRKTKIVAEVERARAEELEASEDYPYSLRCQQALEWFLTHADQLVVWT
jgi:hypothetical protein